MSRYLKRSRFLICKLMTICVLWWFCYELTVLILSTWSTRPLPLNLKRISKNKLAPWLMTFDNDVPVWHDLLVGPKEPAAHNVATLSAYYHPAQRDVVLTVVSDAARITKTGGYSLPHYCAFYDRNKKLTAVVQGKFYTRYLFYCSNGTAGYESSQAPGYVVLIRNRTLWDPVVQPDKYPWLVSVHDLKSARDSLNSGRASLLGELAVCTKTLYGTPNWIMIVQFVEWYKLLGVSKIFMHLRGSVPNHVKLILADYMQQGILDVRPWDIDYSFCPPADKYCHLATHNNCVLRNAYKYRYVLLCDFDELMQPVNQSQTLVSMVKSVDKQRYGSFTFKAAYHMVNKSVHGPKWKDAKQSNTERFVWEHLPFLNYNISALKYMTHLYSPKTIVKPEFVKKMWVHFVKKHFDGKETLYVQAETVGYFHHFKNESEWKQGYINQTMRLTTYAENRPAYIAINNTTIPQYHKLIRNVVTTIKRLMSYDDVQL